MEVVFNLRGDPVSSEEGNRIMENKLSSRESVNCVRRKVLADISNLPQQPKRADLAAKASLVLLRDKEDMEKLQKENMLLAKALADRNRIIELSALELQQLRTDMRKVHEKNLQLAQANTQMLRELNSGKDTIKVLRHELDCKNCLLKVRQLELEEKDKLGACHFNQSEVRDETAKRDDAEDSSQAGKPCITRQRRQRTRSRSSTSAEPVQADENANKKRSCRRRQSARFRHDVAESCSNALEMGDPKTNVLNESLEPLEEKHPALPSSSMQRDQEEKNVAIVENQAHPRPSVGRPLRRAAEKVQSYKEVPVNVKMHRPDVVTFSNEKMYVAPSSTSAERVLPDENVNKKRPCRRRQSDRFISDVAEPCLDLLETGDSKSNVLNACVKPLEENHPAPLSSFTEKEDQEENVAKAENRPHSRASLGRPSRRAAQKVPSYKEVPLNVKMRREE